MCSFSFYVSNGLWSARFQAAAINDFRQVMYESLEQSVLEAFFMVIATRLASLINEATSVN